MLQGRCECGLVSYQADCEVSDFSHCHCSQCRRLHGAAFVSFAGVSRDSLLYLSGEDALKFYDSSERVLRAFCSNCGSNIWAQGKSFPEDLYVCLGTVDGDPELPTGYHQYVDSKAPWHEIADGLEQYADMAPEN